MSDQQQTVAQSIAQLVMDFGIAAFDLGAQRPDERISATWMQSGVVAEKQAAAVAAVQRLAAMLELERRTSTELDALAESFRQQRDAARAELARLTKQRDELLAAAKMAIREIPASTSCSMCHDSTWDHECDSKVNTTHVSLSNAIGGAS